MCPPRYSAPVVRSWVCSSLPAAAAVEFCSLTRHFAHGNRSPIMNKRTEINAPTDLLLKVNKQKYGELFKGIMVHTKSSVIAECSSPEDSVGSSSSCAGVDPCLMESQGSVKVQEEAIGFSRTRRASRSARGPSPPDRFEPPKRVFTVPSTGVDFPHPDWQRQTKIKLFDH